MIKLSTVTNPLLLTISDLTEIYCGSHLCKCDNQSSRTCDLKLDLLRRINNKITSKTDYDPEYDVFSDQADEEFSKHVADVLDDFKYCYNRAKLINNKVYQSPKFYLSIPSNDLVDNPDMMYIAATAVYCPTRAVIHSDVPAGTYKGMFWRDALAKEIGISPNRKEFTDKVSEITRK